MKNESELLARNVEILKSTVNRHGIYGLILALITIMTASLLVGFQMTGKISFSAFLYVQQTNLAIRILDFLPFVFTYWGQMTGYNIAYRAGEIIVAETDELRAETTSWKNKSLHESTHDALTGLPNRVLFYEKIKQAITSISGTQRTVTMLFMDLDGFKEINNTFGHATGDQALKYVSGRLQLTISTDDILARMGGDEFSVLLSMERNKETGVEVARRIKQMLSEPFVIDGQKIDLSVSIGISVCPEHAGDVDILIQCAEIASHAAKTGMEGYVVYSPELKQENPRRLILTSDLRRAIEGEQLQLYYQPKVDISTGRATGVEALLRWNHPEYGYISPEEFTRLAERTRLINELTGLVIKKSINQLKLWRKAGTEIDLSLNITAQDLNNTGLPAYIGDSLANSEVNPAMLALEITESSVMENAERALHVINQLADLKLRLSIDDFGTGYSSLAYLSKLPVHELKIDKSFVLGMRKNRNDRLIVKSTIDLGHNLGLKVTAEGIEDKPTWDTLIAMNCDLGQGYYLSPPLPEAEFMNWLAEFNRNHPH